MQSHNLTRKEKQFLIFILALMFGTALVTRTFHIHPLALTAWVNGHPEILLLFLPLGLYFTLDKQRLPPPPNGALDCSHLGEVPKAEGVE